MKGKKKMGNAMTQRTYRQTVLLQRIVERLGLEMEVDDRLVINGKPLREAGFDEGAYHVWLHELEPRVIAESRYAEASVQELQSKQFSVVFAHCPDCESRCHAVLVRVK